MKHQTSRGGGNFWETAFLALVLVLGCWLFYNAEQQFGAVVGHGDFKVGKRECADPLLSACPSPTISWTKLVRADKDAPVFVRGTEIYDVGEQAAYPWGVLGYRCPAYGLLLLMFGLLAGGPWLCEWAAGKLWQDLHAIRRKPLPPRPPWILPCLFLLLVLGLLLMYCIEPWLVLGRAEKLAGLPMEKPEQLVKAWKDFLAADKDRRLFESHAGGVMWAIAGVLVTQELFSWYKIRSLFERLRSAVWVLLFAVAIVVIKLFASVSQGTNLSSQIVLFGVRLTVADAVRAVLLFASLRFFVQRNALEWLDRHTGTVRYERFRMLLRNYFFIVVLLGACLWVIWSTSGEYALVKVLVGVVVLFLSVWVGFRAHWFRQFGILAVFVVVAAGAWAQTHDFGALLVVLPVLLVLSLFRIRHPLIIVATLAVLSGGAELIYWLDANHGVLNNRLVERVAVVRDPFRGSYQVSSDAQARILWAAKDAGWYRLKLADNPRVAKIPEIDTDLTFGFFTSAGGLVAGLVVIAAYLGLFVGLFGIARHQRLHEQAYWVVIGVSLLLAWQTALNIGATMTVFPLTGIPLTFVGRGTVAMLVNGTLLGLVLGYRGGMFGGRLREMPHKTIG
jgi:cell division protein FtsW (lipid II flippase)